MYFEKKEPIHFIGAAGLEAAAAAEYLYFCGYRNLVLHNLVADFADDFFHNHKFLSTKNKIRRFRLLCRLKLQTGNEYLRHIDQGAAVFIPQAWRMHKANREMDLAQYRYFTYPDLLLMIAKRYTAAITGTAGKSSACELAAFLCRGLYAGNDREACHDLIRISKKAIKPIIFELSNRHLALPPRGEKKFGTGLLLNIIPNHLGETGSFKEYERIKLSAENLCNNFIDLRQSVGIKTRDSEKKAQFSDGSGTGYDGIFFTCNHENICTLQDIPHFKPNDMQTILAAINIAAAAGITPGKIRSRLKRFKPALRYRQNRRTAGEKIFINDSSACLPAATLHAVNRITQDAVLIFGGHRQKPEEDNLDDLIEKLLEKKIPVILTGPLSAYYQEVFKGSRIEFKSADTLEQAFDRALQYGKKTILFSPGGSAYGEKDKYDRGEAFDVLICQYRKKQNIPEPEQHKFNSMKKRLFDLTLSVLLLPACSIVVCVTFFVLMITQGLPVVFLQKRQGRNSSGITLIKFRTMKQGPSSGRAYQEKNRITRIGSFIRKLKIDELFQIWYVLDGRMSFTGPRLLTDNHQPVDANMKTMRLSVKPGLFGPSQLKLLQNGFLDIDEQFTLDCKYATDKQYAKDVCLIAATVKILVSKIIR